ncbi:MAG: methionyl-tRNA formyltransferase [Gammaproteobacteria bacterium]|nr:MAG: methionyl-tRNA formyltransferase [Gammaproteobacteria bacterium]
MSLNAANSLNIVFAGTPDFAVPTLRRLNDSPHHIAAVYTQPDRPAGRGQKPTHSPVKALAKTFGLPVHQPEHLRSTSEKEYLTGLSPDLMIVVAYGLILPTDILSIPRFGCLNVHASILPRWRGAAPIQRAILAGDQESGVTIMQMDKGLDTGDILQTITTPIRPEDTGQKLHDRLSEMGADALLSVVNDIANDHPPTPVSQDDRYATYADKLTKQEAEIDWSNDAQQIFLQIQAFNPWPVAYTSFNGKPLRIWSAMVEPGNSSVAPGCVILANQHGIKVATGDGVINLTQVQPAGKRLMSAADFLNARRDLIQPDYCFDQ